MDEVVEVTGVAATTHQLHTRYGLFQLEREELESLAAAMVDGTGHFNVGHNPAAGWDATAVRAWIEPADGHHILRYQMSVPRSQYERFRAQADEVGVPGGFSVTITRTVRASAGAQVGVVGDAADFTDEELLSLANLFGDDAPVSRLYQLELDPDAIRIVLHVVAAGVAYDLLKKGSRALVSWLADKATASRRPVALDIRLELPSGAVDLHRGVTIHPDSDVAEALAALERIWNRPDP